jgi:hypothetical protein
MQISRTAVGALALPALLALASTMPAHAASGPVINSNAVVNGTDWSPNDIAAGTTVTIFGSGFVAPDTVLVVQGSSQYTIKAGSLWWHDSPTQINATLPGTLALGQATVYVQSATGVLSNGQTIAIHAPTINPNAVVNGTDWSPNDIAAGTTVTIFGSGFVAPDTVLVVQGSSQYTIRAGSLWWHDSPTQINATLPGTLLPGQATVYVRSATGVFSNGQTITIQPT